MLLLMKLEGVEHARTRALAQILMNQEAGVKAFEEYMEVAFPYMEAAKGRDKVEAMKAMKDFVEAGPFGVRPLPTPKMRSKLKHRLVRRDNKKTMTREEENALYEKMGQSIPIR